MRDTLGFTLLNSRIIQLFKSSMNIQEILIKIRKNSEDRENIIINQSPFTIFQISNST